MTLDKSVRDSIIIAAISGAGAIGGDVETWEANVLRGARRITAVLADENSTFGKAVDEIDSSAKFVAVISLVKLEDKSTRGLVYFQIVPKAENGVQAVPRYTHREVVAANNAQAAARAAGNKPPDLPEGLECIRTERTDSTDGLLLAKEAQGLVGHRVVIYKINEPINGGKANVRVVRLITDLGRYEPYVLPEKKKPVEVAAAA